MAGAALPVRAPAQVLTIGATNLAEELDQALLRPGRFEVCAVLCVVLEVCAGEELDQALLDAGRCRGVCACAVPCTAVLLGRGPLEVCAAPCAARDRWVHVDPGIELRVA